MENLTGELRLVFAEKMGRTVTQQVFYQGALRIMRPQYLDDSGMATLFVLNPGGGYVDGDRYLQQIELAPKSQVYLTTQSATKIYQTPKKDVGQKNYFKLAPDSQLINIPDALIPYADADFWQQQRFEMDPSAGLFTSEIVTPGWDPNFSGFAYKRLNLLTEVYQAGRLVVMDRLYLEPAAQDLKASGYFSEDTKVGSLLVIHPKIEATFIQALQAELTETFPSVTLGISALAVPGFAVRLLGTETYILEAVIQTCYQRYAFLVSGKTVEPLRKY